VRPEDLHVFTVRFNPRRFAVPDDHYFAFAAHMERSGVPLYTVEIALGDRPFTCTNARNERHLQLRSPHAMWFKEVGLKRAVERLLPGHAKHIAWVDADVTFQRADWAAETLHMLQHHPIVQMFSQAVDAGPQGQFTRLHAGFGWCWRRFRRGGDEKVSSTGGSYGGTWHSGYAWACTRDFWDAIGGLPDWMILGSADRDLACALIGEADKRLPFAPEGSYRTKLMELQRRCLAAGGRRLGYVEGGVIHSFHGPKSRRGYGSRPKILQRHQFDPDRDLIPDSQGLWRWAPWAEELAVDVDLYLSSRDEDSREMDPP
jgi:hypothetical protein